MSYAPLEISNNAVGFSPSLGYASSTSWNTSNDGGYTPANLLRNPFPQGLVQPSGNQLGASTQLGTLTHDGSPVIPSEELSVATKVLRATALAVEEGKIQALTRSTLQDNQAALDVVVNAMKRYADKVYDHQLADTKAILASEHLGLVAASNAAAESDVPRVLPWRLAQPALRADIDANRLEHDRVVAFDKAADALVKAHADLVANFEIGRAHV